MEPGRIRTAVSEKRECSRLILQSVKCPGTLEGSLASGEFGTGWGEGHCSRHVRVLA